ncbi:hypothetical protein ACS0TY_024875 [Phlomoides rotata]
MAGLQYKFFPTDFLFPLQPPAPAGTTTTGGGDTTTRQVSMVNAWNDKSEDLKQTNSVTSRGKIVKAHPSPSTAYTPIIHNKQKKK